MEELARDLLPGADFRMAEYSIEPARLEFPDFFEQHVATVNMHGKGLQIFLHRHTCTIVKILRISPQQFDAVIVEPLGTLDDAAQIFRMV